MNISFFNLNFLFFFLTFSLFSQEEEMEFAPKRVYDADTIVWFGADFSFFRLSHEKKVGQDEELLGYIDEWNDEFKFGFSNVKLASLLKKKKVINDRSFTDNVTLNFKDRPWIISEKHIVDESEIEGHLIDIESENKGIGLVYVVVNFEKITEPEIKGYFVWFDIETRKMLHIYSSSGRPSTEHVNSYGGTVQISSKTKKNRVPKMQGMTGYWYRGMIDAAVEFADDYKKGIVVEEKQY